MYPPKLLFLILLKQINLKNEKKEINTVTDKKYKDV
jgi:hypothetical protein